MSNEELENVRREYYSLLTTKNYLHSLITRKAELEQNPYIREYCQILEQLNSSGLNYEMLKMSNADLLGEAIARERITESNNIFVCMGAYKTRFQGSTNKNGTIDFRVANSSPKADYKIYSDIEKDVSELMVRIPIEECEKFENEHIVLYPTCLVSREYYKGIKNMFFETAINEGQLKASEKIMEEYNRQKTINKR